MAPNVEPHPRPQPPASHHPPASHQNTNHPNPAPTKTPAAHQPILPPVTNPRQKRRTRHPGQSELRARRGRVSTRGASERVFDRQGLHSRSEEHTSELQSLMHISYAVFCLTKNKPHHNQNT